MVLKYLGAKCCGICNLVSNSSLRKTKELQPSWRHIIMNVNNWWMGKEGSYAILSSGYFQKKKEVFMKLMSTRFSNCTCISSASQIQNVRDSVLKKCQKQQKDTFCCLCQKWPLFCVPVLPVAGLSLGWRCRGGREHTRQRKAPPLSSRPSRESAHLLTLSGFMGCSWDTRVGLEQFRVLSWNKVNKQITVCPT